VARAVAVATVLLAVCFPGLGFADSPGDGVYGRFDGDVSVSEAMGAGAMGVSNPELLLSAELRARYLDSAGVVLAFGWRPAVADASFFAGVELRPFFPVRFLINGFSGHELLDRMVDSIGIELGAVFAPLDSMVGVGLGFGVGFDLPFSDSVAVHLGMRHHRLSADDQGGPDRSISELSLVGLLTFQQRVDVGLAAREQPRYSRD